MLAKGKALPLNALVGILRRQQVTSNTAGNPSKPHLRRVPRQATLSAHYARYIIIIEGVWVVFVDLRTAIIIIVIIIVGTLFWTSGCHNPHHSIHLDLECPHRIASLQGPSQSCPAAAVSCPSVLFRNSPAAIEMSTRQKESRVIQWSLKKQPLVTDLLLLGVKYCYSYKLQVAPIGTLRIGTRGEEGHRTNNAGGQQRLLEQSQEEVREWGTQHPHWGELGCPGEVGIEALAGMEESINTA
ncbi:hypothetical protein E2C01_011302 [Portunus trituberculatus]|uniref:Uncharacterized protein n=1 Tax=Portunus trituberculatus TaxID=210409 RepID=A0A5B7DAP6_PORTR|nr:hypothetical protein [Portunus trituberculatus]